MLTGNINIQLQIIIARTIVIVMMMIVVMLRELVTVKIFQVFQQIQSTNHPMQSQNQKGKPSQGVNLVISILFVLDYSVDCYLSAVAEVKEAKSCSLTLVS